MPQVSHEVQALGGSSRAFDGPDGTDKWNRTEFRKKLLKVSNWFFKDHKYSIRNIQIRVREAIGDTIFLRAELIAEGHEQSDCCSTSVRAGDPGHRLRIRVRYSTEQGTVERWVKLVGEGNAAKINSLVDLLEGRGREWIAEQPRRYLRRYGGQRHWNSS
jgi:hypothetical protein